MSPELARAVRLVQPRIPWTVISDWQNFDVRRAMIEPITENIVGVIEDFIEFCPNGDPAPMTEVLAMAWLVRLERGPEIIDVTANNDLRETIREYERRRTPTEGA